MPGSGAHELPTGQSPPHTGNVAWLQGGRMGSQKQVRFTGSSTHRSFGWHVPPQVAGSLRSQGGGVWQLHTPLARSGVQTNGVGQAPNSQTGNGFAVQGTGHGVPGGGKGGGHIQWKALCMVSTWVGSTMSKISIGPRF